MREGEAEVAGEVESGRMLVFRTGERISAKAGRAGARLLLLGGPAMDGPPLI